MRKIYQIVLTCILTLSCFAMKAAAQPRAAGLRSGYVTEISYEHTIKPETQFIEANLGVDYMHGQAGMRVEATYNFIVATPLWTDRGDWAVYIGPGVCTGYVSDIVKLRESEASAYGASRIHDMGFMTGASMAVGLEYTFWFPLQLSLDFRPTIGLHVNDGAALSSKTHPEETVSVKSRCGIYNYGLMGFVPCLSVRYRF